MSVAVETKSVVPNFARQTDPIWLLLKKQAEEAKRNQQESEYDFSDFFNANVLSQNSYTDALAHILAENLASHTLSYKQLLGVITKALLKNPNIIEASQHDFKAVVDRDPAIQKVLEPFIGSKGFQALQAYRIAHEIYKSGNKLAATMLQSAISKKYQVDIHPAAQIGHGVMIDHATGVVIGETAIVGDNVTFLHEVTLGGSGKESGPRHPIVKDGVTLCAGAKIIGRVTIGKEATVGANATVLADVPAGTTAVGVYKGKNSAKGLRTLFRLRVLGNALLLSLEKPIAHQAGNLTPLDSPANDR